MTTKYVRVETQGRELDLPLEEDGSIPYVTMSGSRVARIDVRCSYICYRRISRIPLACPLQTTTEHGA